jgi:RNA polymerase sigma-70 factor (ECF subfamily)
MMRHLPRQYRRAVELSDLQGWPQQAVARELDLSLSGAKSRIQRGRARLGELMEQCCRIEHSAARGFASFEPTVRSKEFCDTDEKSCVH